MGRWKGKLGKPIQKIMRACWSENSSECNLVEDEKSDKEEEDDREEEFVKEKNVEKESDKNELHDNEKVEDDLLEEEEDNNNEEVEDNPPEEKVEDDEEGDDSEVGACRPEGKEEAGKKMQEFMKMPGCGLRRTLLSSSSEDKGRKRKGSPSGTRMSPQMTYCMVAVMRRTKVGRAMTQRLVEKLEKRLR
jgi:archaellum component FlaD/FlaE